MLVKLEIVVAYIPFVNSYTNEDRYSFIAKTIGILVSSIRFTNIHIVCFLFSFDIAFVWPYQFGIVATLFPF